MPEASVVIGAQAPVLVPPLLSFPFAPAARLPDGSALLIYSSNQRCLSLFCTTSTLVPHLSNPTFLPIFFLSLSLSCSFFSYFPSVPSYTTLVYCGKKTDREHKRKRKGEVEGMAVGGETGPFDFSLEVSPYFNIGFNRAPMP